MATLKKSFFGLLSQVTTTKTTSPLIDGHGYYIQDYNADDDFSNFGVTNENGQKFVPGTLHGTVANTTPNTANVAQIDTVTLTGTFGAAQITATGGLTKLFHFSTLLTTTAANFVTDNAAAYLTQGIVVTNVGDTLVFTANVAGVPFTSPSIANVPYDLDGSVANTQVNRVAVKQINTVTLSGTFGAARITAAGGLTKLFYFDTSLTHTAETFVTDNAADYLEQGIVVTNEDEDLIFTANVAGVGFTAPVITNVPYDLNGANVHTQLNSIAEKQKDTVTLSGVGGAFMVTGTGGLTKIHHYVSSYGSTAANFVTANAAAYLAQGVVVTNSGNDIIFEANVAGTPFTSPVITNLPYDVSGTNANTQENVTAQKQKETITLTGTDGSANVTLAGGLTKAVTYGDDLPDTAADFVTSWAADYLVQGIVVTSNSADIIFEAGAAGTPFTAPAIGNTSGSLSGSVVHTTANRVAVAQIDTLTMNGSFGSCNVTVAGGLTKKVTFDTDLETTVSDFVDNHAASYLAQGIVVTHLNADIIFTANVAGTGFSSPVATLVPGAISGSVVHTTHNNVAAKQIDTVTLSGTFGTSNMITAGGLTKAMTFDTSLDITAANFVTAHAAAYLVEDIVVTSLTNTIIFTASDIEVPFDSPEVDLDPGDLTGTPDPTQANVTAQQQIDDMTLSGSCGTSTVITAGGLTKTMTFDTSLNHTADNFITDHAVDYAAQGITITAHVGIISFRATVSGTPFDSPDVTVVPGNMAGSVVNTMGNTTGIAQVDTVTIEGTSGLSAITTAGGLTKLITFDTDLETTAANFVTDWAANYLSQGIVITSDEDDIIFTANVAGTSFSSPVINGEDIPLHYSHASVLVDMTLSTPDLIVLQDSITGITCEYIEPGNYKLVSDGKFTENKTFYTPGGNIDNVIISVTWSDVNAMYITCYNTSTSTYLDNILVNFPIDIIVYP